MNDIEFQNYVMGIAGLLAKYDNASVRLKDEHTIKEVLEILQSYTLLNPSIEKITNTEWNLKLKTSPKKSAE